MAIPYGTPLPPSSPELSNRAAIVGIGETDYGLDYKASRSKDPNRELPTPETLIGTAFERALADSGLKRSDIDGLSVSMIYGGSDAAQTASQLGITPRYLTDEVGINSGPIPRACAAIAEGKCDTIALVYAAASRAMGRTYGGTTYGTGAPTSYYYYNPWGFSSQAAHWALIWQHYMALHGATEADLGAVAVQLRKHAQANPNAIMQAPMGIEDYLASRYIVAPLHLFDMCLVNDGGVCLIIRRADMAKDGAHTPVLVSGWGESKVKYDKMRNLVCERLHPQCRESLGQATAMAGLSVADIQHFEGYDASSIHLVDQLEGFGLVPSGEGLEHFKRGAATIGGRLPVNTGGGLMSEAYMHGWNQIPEVVRQLRHDAGPRQIADLRVSLSAMAQTDEAHPILYTRGA